MKKSNNRTISKNYLFAKEVILVLFALLGAQNICAKNLHEYPNTSNYLHIQGDAFIYTAQVDYEKINKEKKLNKTKPNVKKKTNPKLHYKVKVAHHLKFKKGVPSHFINTSHPTKYYCNINNNNIEKNLKSIQCNIIENLISQEYVIQHNLYQPNIIIHKKTFDFRSRPPPFFL